VSRRTLTRWECHDELPPLAQRRHLATSFPDVSAELRDALIASLELDERSVASLFAPPRAPSPGGVASGPPALGFDAAAVFDGAFFELCDGLDVAPGRLRAGLAVFLARIGASGVSLEQARARLASRMTTAARR
jgi:hypothetical protein